MVAVLLAVLPHLAAPAKQAALAAVRGTVSGQVQQVGFRALILRQAIRYNLSGRARNLDDGTVEFLLQGEPKRIDRALDGIRPGTAKAADVKVAAAPCAVDGAIETFTVVAWTSTSRDITERYDLVFTPRKDGRTVSAKEADRTYHDILRRTLSPADLEKLGGKGR
jgi:acylphosphatase